jgi:hypothetical protein
MVDYAAAATGATAGVAAARPVSDSLTKIFGNTAAATSKAAHVEADKPSSERRLITLRADSRTPKAPGNAPANASTKSPEAVAPAGAEEAPMIESLFGAPAIPDTEIPKSTFADAIPNPAPLPPPEMTTESFHNVAAGMSRTDLLRMGFPASKITMDEDGHLLEIYSYSQGGSRVGTVRLVDGAVATTKQ